LVRSTGCNPKFYSKGEKGTDHRPTAVALDIERFGLAARLAFRRKCFHVSSMISALIAVIIIGLFIGLFNAALRLFHKLITLPLGIYTPLFRNLPPSLCLASGCSV